jgi:2-methylcitrate dehydratase PrpD
MFTSKIADFVSNTPASTIPEAAIVAAGHGIIDTLGCALAGSLEPVSKFAAAFIREQGARGSVGIWGGDFSSSPADAAFVNAISSHALDFDDSHPSARGHASASLVATVIAAGEATHATGRDVLAAYAIGIEVAGKLGRAYGFGLLGGGWHPTAGVGVLASTVAAARLAGHDAEILTRALGIAGSEISGLVRNFGTMTKPYHTGHCARMGITSSWLAGAGMTSDTSILDGDGGVMHAYQANGEDTNSLGDQLGQGDWEIVSPGNFVKNWPCCYSNHRSIGAMYALIEEHDFSIDEIKKVTVSFLPGGDIALVSRSPKTGLEGKFSIEYVIAAMLLRDPLTLTTFTDPMVMRPEAQALIPKVERIIIPAEGKFSGMVGYNIVEVTTTRGTFTRRQDITPGSPKDWPIGNDGRATKFIDCARLVLGNDGAQSALACANSLDGLADITELSKTCVPISGHLRGNQK